MVSILYEKIELLLITSLVKIDNNALQSIDKIVFENASIHLSGDYMIITTHNKENENDSVSNVYPLDRVKSYKTK